ncbi:hypothetical protein CCR80_10315 [Rhodothalassium salexigens]|nr:hypothetical protein [Rhodothalassium salexigens]
MDGAGGLGAATGSAEALRRSPLPTATGAPDPGPRTAPCRPAIARYAVAHCRPCPLLEEPTITDPAATASDRDPAPADRTAVDRTGAHARIWRIAGPAILANVSTALIGLVDTWAVGHLPDPALLAAIGVGAFIFNYLFWAAGFLRMGTTGTVAQAHGQDDQTRIARIVLRSLLLALALGALILVLRDALLAGALAFIDPETRLDGPIGTYFGIRIWSAPAVLARLVVLGLLLGTGRARTALALEVFVNLVNAGLTVWFVQGLGWALAGAAAASAIAEALSAVLGLALALALLGRAHLAAILRTPGFWRPRAFATLLSGNAFLLMRTLLLLSVFALIWKIGTGVSSTIAAANQVLLQFLTLAALALDGLAYAAEAEVGRAVGRQDRGLVHRMTAVTALWSALAAAALSATYALAGDAIVALFTDHASVRAAAGAHLAWLVAMPMVAVWSYQFDGVFVGLNAFRAMFATMALAFAGFAAVALWAVPLWGNHGLWAAVTVFMGLRGLAQALWYRPLVRARLAEPATAPAAV